MSVPDDLLIRQVSKQHHVVEMVHAYYVCTINVINVLCDVFSTLGTVHVYIYIYIIYKQVTTKLVLLMNIFPVIITASVSSLCSPHIA